MNRIWIWESVLIGLSGGILVGVFIAPLVRPWESVHGMVLCILFCFSWPLVFRWIFGNKFGGRVK